MAKCDEKILIQEQMVEVGQKSQTRSIGLPAPEHTFDYNVPITPQSVQLLTDSGYKVVIEKGVGKAANFTDLNFSDAGGDVVESKAKVLQCDYVIKSTPLTRDEINLLRGNQIVFSSIDLSECCPDSIRQLMAKRITCVAFEYLQDETGALPIMHSINEISGIVAINIASEYLSITNKGKGILLGGVTGISPTEVVILGSETAAVNAARTAMGQGVLVKVFDNSVGKLREFQQRLGHQTFTSLYYPRVLSKALASADAVVSAQPSNRMPNYVVPEKMIQEMKQGAIIVDLNISQGGAFETSRATTLAKPTFKKHKVIHYCVPDISSHVPRTTSIALSNILTSILEEVNDCGGFRNYIRRYKSVQEGIYIYNGILTNRDIGIKFNIPFKQMDLLMLAF